VIFVGCFAGCNRFIISKDFGTHLGTLTLPCSQSCRLDTEHPSCAASWDWESERAARAVRRSAGVMRQSP